MLEGKKGRGRPSKEVTGYKTHGERGGRSGARKDTKRVDPFSALVELPPRKGNTPYPREVFERVDEKLRNLVVSQPQFGWDFLRFNKKTRDTIVMVREGFRAVVYSHLGGGDQAALQDEYFSRLDGHETNLRTHVFGEQVRIFKDRIELTYEQAKIVQQIVNTLNVSYDPGGEENTPENIAKRTFKYDDYFGRPIAASPGGYVESPRQDKAIKAYLKAKKRVQVRPS